MLWLLSCCSLFCPPLFLVFRASACWSYSPLRTEQKRSKRSGMLEGCRTWNPKPLVQFPSWQLTGFVTPRSSVSIARTLVHSHLVGQPPMHQLELSQVISDFVSLFLSFVPSTQSRFNNVPDENECGVGRTTDSSITPQASKTVQRSHPPRLQKATE